MKSPLPFPVEPLLPLAREAADEHRACFGQEPEGMALAPGRVNLIGDHTDYNEGFVLPMAIGQGVAFAFRPRDDGRLRVRSVAHGKTREADLAHLVRSGETTFLTYVEGVAWALREGGRPLRGLDAVMAGNLPIGAGLSSSAAVELAAARAFAAASSLSWDAMAMAEVCQHAENAYVGVSCGIMDQFAVATATEGAALLLDCRSLRGRPVPLPEEAVLVVMDTGSRRGLAASAYNERRASCEKAVGALATLRPGLRALRDVDDELLRAGGELLDPTTRARAAHVVGENARPLALAKAFARGDLEEAGRLMNDSHASLRDLYEVSAPELDIVTDLARAHPACLGARLTGAGFGGCAVALVREEGATDFVARVGADYRKHRPDLPSSLFACRPAAGARLLPVSEL